jgi:uncharacterized phiE125 gp8 family phage protein
VSYSLETPPSWWPSWDDVRPIHFAAIQSTAPAVLITTDEAKLHCRIDATSDDAQVPKWVEAATTQVEQDSGVCLMSQIWDLTFDRFPSGRAPLVLPKSPLLSIGSVKYYDSGNTLQTMTSSDYVADVMSLPSRIGLAPTASWPSDVRLFQPVLIRATFGFSAATTVPENLVQAVRLLLATFAENRGVEEFGGSERRLYDWLVRGQSVAGFV